MLAGRIHEGAPKYATMAYCRHTVRQPSAHEYRVQGVAIGQRDAWRGEGHAAYRNGRHCGFHDGRSELECRGCHIMGESFYLAGHGEVIATIRSSTEPDVG